VQDQQLVINQMAITKEQNPFLVRSPDLEHSWREVSRALGFDRRSQFIGEIPRRAPLTALHSSVVEAYGELLSSRQVFVLESPRVAIEPSQSSTTKLQRIMEEVRELSPEHQILLRDRINLWLQQRHSPAESATNDDARRETIRRAKGSMAGLIPS